MDPSSLIPSLSLKGKKKKKHIWPSERPLGPLSEPLPDVNLAYLNVFVHAARVLENWGGGVENGEGREVEFQHKPPSIDTIENINRTDMTC